MLYEIITKMQVVANSEKEAIQKAVEYNSSLQKSLVYKWEKQVAIVDCDVNLLSETKTEVEEKA